MKIAIDIDEVVAEFIDCFLEKFNKENNTNFKREDITSYNYWECLPMTQEEAYKSVESFFDSSYAENIGIVDKSVESIIELAKNHEIFFITSRKQKYEEQTLQFLNKYFSNINFVLIFSNDWHVSQGKDKSEICLDNGINIIIEDNGEHSIKYANKGLKVLLLEKPWNKNFNHKNIIRFKAWPEILAYIKNTNIEKSAPEHKEESLIEKTKKFVEQECKDPNSHYAYEVFFCHFIPMVAHAKNLAKDKKDIDQEVIELAAWLHDIGSIKCGRKDHHITGSQIAEQKLREWGLEESKIQKVKECIFCHRGSQNIKRNIKEAQIIADADTISAFDNVSGLFKAAIFDEKLNQIQAKASVKQKLINSWEKLSEEARYIIRPKYEAAMILLE